MKTPVHVIWAHVVLTVVGTAMMVPAIMLGKQVGPALGIAALVGCSLVIWGVAGGLAYVPDLRRYRKLMRGEGVLAQWTVTPTEWMGFVARNRELNAQSKTREFKIRQPGVPRNGPVEVVIGEKGLMVDGEFHSFVLAGAGHVGGPWWREGSPDVLEYHCSTVVGESDMEVHWAVRVPVPAGVSLGRVQVLRYPATSAEADVTAAAERGPPLPSVRNHRRWRNVMLVLALILGATAAAFFIGLPYWKAHREWHVPAMVGGIVGILGCPAALLLALVSHMQIKRSY